MGIFDCQKNQMTDKKITDVYPLKIKSLTGCIYPYMDIEDMILSII